MRSNTRPESWLSLVLGGEKYLKGNEKMLNDPRLRLTKCLTGQSLECISFHCTSNLGSPPTNEIRERDVLLKVHPEIEGDEC